MKLHFVDRDDQARWYADPEWTYLTLTLSENPRAMRLWIEDTLQGEVVISGQGILPPRGGMYHPTEMIYASIQNDFYKIYFELDSDAVLFKLTWGCSPRGTL